MFLRGAVFNSTNTDRARAHNRRCDSNRDYNQLLDGWHDHLRPADGRHHLVLLTASTERELAVSFQQIVHPVLTEETEVAEASDSEGKPDEHA